MEQLTGPGRQYTYNLAVALGEGPHARRVGGGSISAAAACPHQHCSHLLSLTLAIVRMTIAATVRYQTQAMLSQSELQPFVVILESLQLSLEVALCRRFRF